MIQTENIQYELEAKRIIQSLDVTIKPVMTALVGPNGSGKTTLLRLLSRYYQPTQGKITLNGRLLSQYTPIELSREIAVMSQEEWLPYTIGVVEYVLLGRLSLSQSGFFDEAQNRGFALKALEYVGASHLIGRSIHTLSGGEKQRVSLARAIAQDPKYLFLDEPISHMDWAWQKKSLELIHKLNRQKNIGVLSVVHDPNLVSFYFDEVIFIREGRVIKEGPVAQVLTADVLACVFDVEFDVYSNDQAHQVFVPHTKSL